MGFEACDGGILPEMAPGCVRLALYCLHLLNATNPLMAVTR